MTQYSLRAHGQIRAGDAGTPIDGTAWHDVCIYTTTVSGAAVGSDPLPFGYGQQRRSKYQYSDAEIAAPIAEPGTTLTIPKGSNIIVNAGLGYTNSTSGAILKATDAGEFARFRIVTGTGARTAEVGFAECIPDSALSAHFSVDPAVIESAFPALPPKAAIPVISQVQHDDGNYMVSFSRRFAIRTGADIVVPANGGFAIQMRTNTLQRGFEYDVLCSIVIT